MTPTRILGSIAAAALGIAMLGACSTESLTEAAVSFGLEQAIEGNEDIDLDFGDDGSGGFSISTEEGEFGINFDEDGGGITFDTEDGDGVISFDEDGIVYDTDQGDGVISFDQDNGEIVFDTDAGDGVISFDEDNGSVTFDGDAGSAALGVNGVPDNWPAAIGIPATVNPETMRFTSIDTGAGMLMSGEFQHAAGDRFANDAATALGAMGLTLQIETGEGTYREFATEDGGTNVTIRTDGTTTAVTVRIRG